jgi:hypothetical protein
MWLTIPRSIRLHKGPAAFERPGALPGKGKRGGIRVIYFYRSTAGVVYFLDAYAKNVKADLTPADKQQLRALVNRLKGIQ